MQLAQVRHTALCQIDVRLHGDARGHGGPLHQVGVGGLLTADHHGRDPARDDGVDSVLQGAVAAEDPDDHDRGTVEQFREFAGSQPGWVGPAVVRTAGTRGNQVGVGGRQQDNRGPGHPLFVPQRCHRLTPGRVVRWSGGPIAQG